ncbi:MAG: hypothetical protein KF718_12575 [Polyangiaceae bacterium]|nr:hypothetical protein [Polyangiaceae bacterium]
MSALTLTASGPLRWNHDPDAVDVPLPTFDLFAPIGTAYQSSGAKAVVWLELSDAPTFSTAGYFARVELNIDWFQRVNCAPAGFARLLGDARARAGGLRRRLHAPAVELAWAVRWRVAVRVDPWRARHGGARRQPEHGARRRARGLPFDHAQR